MVAARRRLKSSHFDFGRFDTAPGAQFSLRYKGPVTFPLSRGVFTDKIVRHLGGNPSVHAAIGVGYGLERCAMLRYGIDDIRKVERARVA